MQRDEGFLFPRENRLVLTNDGYRELCRMVDKRDSDEKGKPRCIICNSTSNLHHHHVRFRSLYGSDREDNLVLLCSGCHEIYAHGKKEKAYMGLFKEYLMLPRIVAWREAHRAELERIYEKVQHGPKRKWNSPKRKWKKKSKSWRR